MRGLDWSNEIFALTPPPNIVDYHGGCLIDWTHSMDKIEVTGLQPCSNATTNANPIDFDIQLYDKAGNIIPLSTINFLHPISYAEDIDIFPMTNTTWKYMNVLALREVNMNLEPVYFFADESSISSTLSFEEFLETYITCRYTTEILDLDQLYWDCRAALVAQAEADAKREYDRIIDEYLTQFIQEQSQCLSDITETFTATYDNKEYHYTLYYHDQVGNLIQTVPPAGVNPLTLSFFPGGIWDGTDPAHTLITTYRYNSLGQVVTQNTPDGGTSNFYYDYAQRLRVSQDARQEAINDFSYTMYDRQSRIIEVGEINFDDNLTTVITDADLNDPDFPGNYPSSFNTQSVNRTYYDDVQSGAPTDFSSVFSRGRVTKTEYDDGIDTYYSYDVHGNVKTLYHTIEPFSTDADLKSKRIDYDYDLISGNVNEVSYQAGMQDQFYHRYCYDADNRITQVWTSEDGSIWENDARYFYYMHGPLARVECGNDKIQGMDYYYTLQGWIKGVNEAGTNTLGTEPGQDGNLANSDNLNRYFGKDEVSYALGYHDQDYTPISGSTFGTLQAEWASVINNAILGIGSKEGLYNGNIAMMITDIEYFNNGNNEGWQAMAYQYDQLHRIRYANSFTNQGSFNFGDSQASYTYDGNGNLQSLNRSAFNATTGNKELMDGLIYHYDNGPNGNNRLLFIEDSEDDALFDNDFDGQLADNYAYDEIGNLIKDDKEGITDIEWNVYGKVTKVIRTGAPEVSYRYDAAGNRLSKKVGTETTWYIRDASGNIMSIYKQEENTNTIAQDEVPLYGSSRLGQRNFDEDERVLATTWELGTSRLRHRGKRAYEASNHLGNVLATCSDQKERAGVTATDPYVAVTLTASDYFPFGLQMPGRMLNEPDYRYGFNGKENSEGGEWGTQLVQDYGFRLYNPAIGRFLSLDPLARSFPWNSPYAFAENDVIRSIDLEGLEKAIVLNRFSEGNKIRTTILELTNSEGIVNFNAVGNGIHSLTINDILEINLGSLPSGTKPYDVRRGDGNYFTSNFTDDETKILNAGVDASRPIPHRVSREDKMNNIAGFTFDGATPKLNGPDNTLSNSTGAYYPVPIYDDRERDEVEDLIVPFGSNSVGNAFGFVPTTGEIAPNPSNIKGYKEFENLIKIAEKNGVKDINVGINAKGTIPTGTNIDILSNQIANDIRSQFKYSGNINVNLNFIGSNPANITVSSPAGTVTKRVKKTITERIQIGIEWRLDPDG